MLTAIGLVTTIRTVPVPITSPGLAETESSTGTGKLARTAKMYSVNNGFTDSADSQLDVQICGDVFAGNLADPENQCLLVGNRALSLPLSNGSGYGVAVIRYIDIRHRINLLFFDQQKLGLLGLLSHCFVISHCLWSHDDSRISKVPC